VIVGSVAGTELRPELIYVVRTAQLGAESSRAKVERVGGGTCSGGGVEADVGARVASLGLGLKLLLLHLLYLLGLCQLVLLILQGLDPEHLELEHLHLQLGLGVDIRREARAKGDGVGVHGTTKALLSSKAVLGAIDGGCEGNVHRMVMGVVGDVREIVEGVVVWEDVRGAEGRAGDIE
jgi:hypothetical protein